MYSETNDELGNDSRTIKSRYAALEMDREPFMIRARAASVLTLPTLIMPKGATKTTELPTPYQSLAARGVNNLAAKLLLALFPPNTPFFKLTMDDALRSELGASVGDVDKALSKAERIIIRDLETTATRPALFNSVKHLLVSGNCLTYDDPDTRSLRMFPLGSYVCQRDASGNPLEIITRELLNEESLSKEVRVLLEADKDSQLEKKSKVADSDGQVELYTRVALEDDKWLVTQEVCDVAIPASNTTYSKESLPWHAARLSIVENENYGRGFVEEYFGDIQSLELLSKAMVRSSVAASKIVFMVNPNGVTDEQDLIEADGGDVITGTATDVTTLQLNKGADFAVVERRITALETSLASAFLLNSSVQRNAERVTAEEIRFLANELETSLGGIYSALSQEFQLPIVRSRMALLTKQNKLPKLPRDMVSPMVTTGLDAIGRGNDFSRIQGLVTFLSGALGPEQTYAILNPAELVARAAAAIGVDPEGLVKTPEQMQQEQQQMHTEQMQQNAAGQLAQSIAPPPTQQ